MGFAKRGLSEEVLAEFYQKLKGDVCDMLSRKNKYENLGGIAAIQALVRIERSPFGSDVNLSVFGRNLFNVSQNLCLCHEFVHSVVVLSCTTIFEFTVLSMSYFVKSELHSFYDLLACSLQFRHLSIVLHRVYLPTESTRLPSVVANQVSCPPKVLPPFGTDFEVVHAACKALGVLAAHEMGPNMTQQFVSTHAEKALEWLEHSTARDDLKHHACATILEELVLARPSEFTQHIPRVFQCIFLVIKGGKITLRETGVRVLKHCLLAWRGRSLYPAIYREIEIGFNSRDEASTCVSVQIGSTAIPPVYTDEVVLKEYT